MDFKQESVLLAEASERFGVEFFHDLHTFDCKENPEGRFARKTTREAAIWLGKDPIYCAKFFGQL
jgi:hypothetical protein